jgi:hypothetical protein
VPAAQTVPQAPQFALSVWVLAQYGAPFTGVQSVSVPPSIEAHASSHFPATQSVPALHAVPQVPQLSLSVFVSAQYAAPASPPARQRVLPPPSPHRRPSPEQTPDTQLSLAAHACPHPPQLALSLIVSAQ